MQYRILLLALLSFCASAQTLTVDNCPGTAAETMPPAPASRIPGFVVDHGAVDAFDRIPDSLLPSAAALRVMFRHASVGTTINNGLECVQGTRTNPPECRNYPAYKYDRRNWTCQIRPNSGWYGKVNDFKAEVTAQSGNFDVFSFKYCYLDGLDGLQEPCGNPGSDNIRRAWEYLRDNMEQLERDYPEKIFVWWTIPLTQIGQFCTDTLNALIRAHARQNGKILFDIADIEAHDAQGMHQVNANGWEIAYKPFCGEQAPDAQACHPNWTGGIRIAKAFWWMMASIASNGVATGVRASTPDDMRLSIYPNPFSAGTTIEFTGPASGSATLHVADALGRIVAVRALRPDTGGAALLHFDAGDLPPGVYRFLASNGAGSLSKTALILR